jgi:hypothetical protein
LCRQFLDDSRFEISVQKTRLGWVRNIDWLQRQANGEFWCYLQQDDVIDPTYLEVLIDHARRWPQAAVVYCDMETFGDRSSHFARSSVVGSPFARQLSLLTDHFAGVAFRGLTRVAALTDTGGGMVENDADNFAAETVWSSTMATWGDLIQVPATLYRKRYHDQSAHSAWLAWDLPQRVAAWIAHCHDVLQVAMTVPASRSERWLLWLATVNRLTASRATLYLPWADFTDVDRVTMIDELLTRTQRLARIDMRSLLDASWDQIRRHTLEFADSTG